MKNFFAHIEILVFTSHRGVYDLVDIPPPNPASDQEHHHMVSQPMVFQLREPQPLKPRPRDIFLYESLGIILS